MPDPRWSANPFDWDETTDRSDDELHDIEVAYEVVFTVQANNVKDAVRQYTEMLVSWTDEYGVQLDEADLRFYDQENNEARTCDDCGRLEPASNSPDWPNGVCVACQEKRDV